MRKEILVSGKDVEIAVQNAVAALGAEDITEISYEIVDLGSKGIFGIGARPTKVKAWIELPDTVAPRQHGEAGKAKSAPKAEKVENEAEGAESSDRPRSRNRRRGRGGKNRDNRVLHDFVAPATPSKPREAVIPEAELKMEPVTVEAGEDLSFDFVKLLVENLGIDATVSLFHCEDNSRRITITGEGASALIGHHGEALDSLQYLANLASAKKNAAGERDRRRVTIDIEGYRAKREETLRALARKMAAKALRNGKNVMLEPMSAYERRIIHSEVQGIEGVATNSIGSDNNRKIVIYVTNDKPAAVEETEEDVLSVEEPIAEIAPVEEEAATEAAETTADETVKEEADAEL
ncbi:MAG: Jag N-terminal domain-containing protein [Clostridia bacterium]|nr:Jag N-terminal domain-containing protein [Clostridia bacterium]